MDQHNHIPSDVPNSSSAICGVFLQGLQQGNVPQTLLQPWGVELTTMGGRINNHAGSN